MCSDMSLYLFNELPENEEKAQPSPPALGHLYRERAKTQSSLNQPWAMPQKVLTIFPWQWRQLQSAVCSAPTKLFCSSLFTSAMKHVEVPTKHHFNDKHQDKTVFPQWARNKRAKYAVLGSYVEFWRINHMTSLQLRLGYK